MKNRNHLIWVKRPLVLGAVAAGIMASAAGSATSSTGNRGASAPDVIERYAAAHPYGTTSPPDAIERYVAVHPYGRGLINSAPTTDRIVDDSFRDQPKVATPVGDRIVDDSFRDQPNVATPVGDRIVDDSFRDQPNIATPVGDRIVDDSFRDAAPVGTLSSGNGLHWGDFGLGAAAMLGLTVLVGALGLGLGAHGRHKSRASLGTS